MEIGLASFFNINRGDPWNIRDYVIKNTYPLIHEYYQWYLEHGLHLPETLAQDPTEWTEILRKMDRAFSLYLTRDDEDGLWQDAKRSHRDNELWPKYEAEMQEGFALFGKYLKELRDDKRYHPNAA